jgi:hypothetical protein
MFIIDFSRAFDTVDRGILLHKLYRLEMPVSVKNWISYFLSNRSQCTTCNGRILLSLPVNLGVVQGSALGPMLFTVMVSDLRPICADNDLIKYADDCTLLVPENSNTDLSVEFEAVKAWAAENKLCINLVKTKEIVFHRPTPHHPIPPPPMSGIERVTVAKLLGVYLKENLSFSVHVDFIVRQCSQRMFLLRALRNRGLSPTSLQAVFTALVLSRIIYAISAWGGFASAAEQQKLDKVLSKSHKYGYCVTRSRFEELLESADKVLFKKAQSNKHSLYNLLPPIRISNTVLRERGHPFIVPSCKHELFKRSFITRSLFKFI